VQPKTEESGLFEKSSSADVELAKTEKKADDSLENSVESSFDNLFGKNSDDELSLDDLKLEEAPAPENTPAEVKKETTLDNSVDSSFDHIFGKDSDDALLEDPTTSTRTLAEIYFGQGVYDEAIKIYKDLLRKNPEDAALKDRLAEIEKIRNDKTLN
jgi:tetratricopeptide (TPR) repeat protein